MLIVYGNEYMVTVQSLHKLASPLLYKSRIYQHLWHARSRRKPFTFVAFYHRVIADSTGNVEGFDIENGISASTFEKQMRFMRRHFAPVKASLAQTASESAMQFAVTLDDGYEDNYLIAAPILRKLGIPAAFYVVSDFVGTDRLFWWEQLASMMRQSTVTALNMKEIFQDLGEFDQKPAILPMQKLQQRNYAYKQLCAILRNRRHTDIPDYMKRVSDYLGVRACEEGRDYGFMDWGQLQVLAKQGFEIGCHTATHCNVAGMNDTVLADELSRSALDIENHLDCPVESFAYPYGVYEKSSKSVSDALARTNCKVAYTIEQGVVDASSAPLELPRAKLNRPYDFACAYNIQDTLNCS